MPFPWEYLRIDEDDADLLKAKYKEEYRLRYVEDEDGAPRDWRDWRTVLCRFDIRTFDHAFSASDDYKLGLPHTDELCLERAIRMAWIGEALRGDVPMYVRHTSREIKRPTGSRKRRRVTRRVLLIPDERYMVVMTINANGALDFVTAYCPENDGWNRAMGEGGLVDRKNNPH
ncbi:MAG: hypothetical protein ACYC7C_05165 [Coriobacteriia bacterium]